MLVPRFSQELRRSVHGWAVLHRWAGQALQYNFYAREKFVLFLLSTSQRTNCLINWPLEQENATLTELFIGRIRDIDLQRQLIKARVNLEDTLQLVLESEKGAKT